MANVDDLEDEEVDPICHGNLAGFNWRMTCNFTKFANFAKLFPHQTFPLYGIALWYLLMYSNCLTWNPSKQQAVINLSAMLLLKVRIFVFT